jgi:hypothetical protein
MRKLRTLCMAVVLTFAFAGHSFAGIIGTGPEAPPSPPEQEGGIIGSPPSSSSLVTAVAVDLIQIAVR